MFQRMADAIKGMAGTVYSAATGCINKAVDFIKALPEKALGWGKDFINGFAKGIANAASAVVDNVRGLADDIRSLLHFSRPDEGRCAITKSGLWTSSTVTLMQCAVPCRTCKRPLTASPQEWQSW